MNKIEEVYVICNRARWHTDFFRDEEENIYDTVCDENEVH